MPSHRSAFSCLLLLLLSGAAWARRAEPASVKLFEPDVPARKLVLGVSFYGHMWGSVGGVMFWSYESDLSGELLRTLDDVLRPGAWTGGVQ